MNKRLYYAGIVVHLCLIGLAVLFYKERTIFIDNSFFLFDIVKNASFTIQRYRFIAALPQILPLLAVKASLSLKMVAIAYSLGFALFHFACYLITGSVLKNYRLALVLLLTYIIFTTHTFFWELSELLLGISLMIPLLALVLSAVKMNKILFWLLISAGMVTVCFSHPLITIPLGYTILFLFLSKDTDIVAHKKRLVIISVMIVLIFIVKALFFTDNYEEGSISFLQYFVTLFPNYFSTYANQRFAQNLLSIYYWLPILLAVIVFMYAAKRQWLKLALILLSCFVYSQIVNVSFYGDYTPDFYRENMYIPLALFLALSLVYDFSIRVNNKVFMALLLLVSTTSIFRIYQQSHFYKNRINWYRGYLEDHKGMKILADYDNPDIPHGTIIMSWATCYEFWLLSTIESGSTASVVILDDIDEVGWAYDKKSSFVATWGVFDYKDLNPKYFNFSDTQMHYIFIR